MRNPVSVKRIVFIDLLLHTAIIIVLTFFMARGAMSPARLVSLFSLLFAAVMLTAYTAYRIIQSVTEAFAVRAAELNKMSSGLQAASVNLVQYAFELDKRAKLVHKKEKQLDDKIGVLSLYGDMMVELVHSIDASGDNSSKVSPAIGQTASNKKIRG